MFCIVTQRCIDIVDMNIEHKYWIKNLYKVWKFVRNNPSAFLSAYSYIVMPRLRKPTKKQDR